MCCSAASRAARRTSRSQSSSPASRSTRYRRHAGQSCGACGSIDLVSQPRRRFANLSFNEARHDGQVVWRRRRMNHLVSQPRGSPWRRRRMDLVPQPHERLTATTTTTHSPRRPAAAARLHTSHLASSTCGCGRRSFDELVARVPTAPIIPLTKDDTDTSNFDPYPDSIEEAPAPAFSGKDPFAEF